MRFLRPLESFIGVFQGLFGMLLCGLVVFFPVVCGSGTMRVCGEFVEFSSSLVRVTGTAFPWFRLHLRIIPFPKLSTCGHGPGGYHPRISVAPRLG
jgi:hypothetical protein